MTAALVWVLVLLFATYVALIAPTLIKLFRRPKIEDISPEWLERFSARSYRPMERLLNGEDFAFLSRQPGFDMALYRKFRKDRLQIFRQYMTRLIVDFNRLHLIARLLVAQADQDQSDLLAKLIWLRVKFWGAALEAESRYFLCCIGVRSLTVRSLVLKLEELSSQVAELGAMQTA